MKVLLDECVPRKIKPLFAGHECQTVPEAGLAGKKNGILLAAAEEAGFEVFVSLDKGLQYQQNLTGRRILSRAANLGCDHLESHKSFGGRGALHRCMP